MASVFDDYHQQQQQAGGSVFDDYHAQQQEPEGLLDRYLRQSGISNVWKLLTGPSDIPASGPERRAAQNARIAELFKPVTDVASAAREGKFAEAGNKTGEFLGNIIPGVHQAGDAINDIAQGDYRYILPDLLGGVTQVGAAAGAGKLLNLRGPAARAAATAGAGEGEFLKNTQPAVATYAPKNKIKYFQDLRRAIPLMQEQNPNVKVDLMSNDLTAPRQIGPSQPVADTFLPANTAAIAKIDSQFEPMLTRADTYGITGNGKTIVKQILDSIPDKYRVFNADGYEALKNSLAPYENQQFTPRQLNAFKQTTNAQLSKFYEGLSGQVNDTLAANAHMNSLEAEATALRNEIYTKIDPEHNGEWASELMERRGALQNVRDTHEALVNKTIGNHQPNLLQRAAGTIGVAMRGPKAMAFEAAARPATAAANIEKAFNQKIDPLPSMPPVPPVYPRNPLQLPPATPQIQPHGYGSVNPTQVTITTGAPLQVSEPAPPLTPTERGEFIRQRDFNENPTGKGFNKYPWEELNPPELKLSRPPAETFDWQRMLFPESPERPVEPPPK